MQINPEMVKLWDKYGLDHTQALLVCTTAQFRPREELSVLTELDILNGNNQIVLLQEIMNYDYDKGRYTLRTPLFTVGQADDFDRFLDMLYATGSIKAFGHINNPANAPVINDDAETRKEFTLLQQRIPNLDLERLVKVTVELYAKSEMVKGLKRLIVENIYREYQNYVEY